MSKDEKKPDKKNMMPVKKVENKKVEAKATPKKEVAVKKVATPTEVKGQGKKVAVPKTTAVKEASKAEGVKTVDAKAKLQNTKVKQTDVAKKPAKAEKVVAKPTSSAKAEKSIAKPVKASENLNIASVKPKSARANERVKAEQQPAKIINKKVVKVDLNRKESFADKLKLVKSTPVSQEVPPKIKVASSQNNVGASSGLSSARKIDQLISNVLADSPTESSKKIKGSEPKLAKGVDKKETDKSVLAIEKILGSSLGKR